MAVTVQSYRNGGMSGPLGNDLYMNAIHEKVADMGMPQPMKRNRVDLGTFNKPGELFREVSRVDPRAVMAGEYHIIRVASKPHRHTLP